MNTQVAFDVARKKIAEVFVPDVEAREAEEVENTIYCSHDLNRFMPDLLNRPIEEGRLAKLMKSIEKVNLLHLFPIIIGRDYGVRDGHHRLEAAKRMGLPIYYVISDLMTIDMARGVTKATSTWTPYDYLHHWCQVGMPDYLILRDFIRQYKFITLMFAVDILSVNERAGLSRKVYFEDGHFKAVTLPLAHSIACMLIDFKEFVPFYRDKSFVALVKFLAMQPNYDHKRMLTKLAYQQGRLTKQPDVNRYVQVVNEIYNNRTVEKDRVWFHRPRFR